MFLSRLTPRHPAVLLFSFLSLPFLFHPSDFSRALFSFSRKPCHARIIRRNSNNERETERERARRAVNEVASVWHENFCRRARLRREKKTKILISANEGARTSLQNRGSRRFKCLLRSATSRVEGASAISRQCVFAPVYRFLH